MNKLWKKFERASQKCYTEMLTESADLKLWNEAYNALLDAVEDERSRRADYAKELYELDEETDYEYDVEGWLEDYMDELELHDEFDTLIQVCRHIIQMFQWKEVSPAGLRFRIAAALGSQRKSEEAHRFCEEWYNQEPDHILAATATVYGRIEVRDMDGAQQIIDRYITDDTDCTDDNDIMFIAAETFYKVKGNKKAEKKILKAIRRYEKEMEEFFEGMEDIDIDGFDLLDEDLPFN